MSCSYKQDSEDNEKHETALHNAEDYQEPHSWIDVINYLQQK